MKRTVEDIIEIGKELTAVKDRLEHGQFLPWIKAEFDMSADTAHRMINVAARFGQIPQIAEFKPSILYALAAPSTPAAVIDQALEKAESGEPVTLADVQDWKAKAADLELALKEQTETIDFFKQQAYSTGDELATARRRQPNSAGGTRPIVKARHPRRNRPAFGDHRFHQGIEWYILAKRWYISSLR